MLPRLRLISAHGGHSATMSRTSEADIPPRAVHDGDRPTAEISDRTRQVLFRLLHRGSQNLGNGVLFIFYEH
jgi:hypothetical protein